MNTAEIIKLIAGVIKTAVDLTPVVIKTVEDAKPFAEPIAKLFKKEEVTKEEMDAVEAQIASLSNALQQPLPAETEEDV